MPDTPMYAPEYTPELSKSYLDSILGGIDDQSRVDEGRAAAEAASRGLLDQGAFMGSSVGQVRKGVAAQKSGTIGQFNLAVADRKREERLGEKSRGWQVEDRDFAAQEAQKSRDFQKMMAELGYDFAEHERGKDAEFNLGGFASGVLGTGLSAYVGSRFGRR